MRLDRAVRVCLSVFQNTNPAACLLLVFPVSGPFHHSFPACVLLRPVALELPSSSQQVGFYALMCGAHLMPCRCMLGPTGNAPVFRCR
jgi:hypothetical protein